MRFLDQLAQKVSSLISQGALGDKDSAEAATKGLAATAQRATSRALVSGPKSVGQPAERIVYTPLQDSRRADEAFFRLRRLLFQAADAHQDKGEEPLGLIFREAGKLPPSRPYFYLKRLNEIGWLFERSGAGWVVSRAEKIVNRDLFLRPDEPWDVVAIFASSPTTPGSHGLVKPTAPSVVSPLRISSARNSGELISSTVYEQRLIESLGLPQLT